MFEDFAPAGMFQSILGENASTGPTPQQEWSGTYRNCNDCASFAENFFRSFYDMLCNCVVSSCVNCMMLNII
jgi:hypothetical protein